jgi:hypothetical protein
VLAVAKVPFPKSLARHDCFQIGRPAHSSRAWYPVLVVLFLFRKPYFGVQSGSKIFSLQSGLK